MPVGVVRTHADEPDRRRELAVESGVLVRRAVVRHLDDVDGSRFDRVAQPPLRALVEVPEERRAQAGPARSARPRS